jgi:hypothetical protein
LRTCLGDKRTDFLEELETGDVGCGEPWKVVEGEWELGLRAPPYVGRRPPGA